MDLRTLRYFVYVAEARSFSKAAAQLRIAQPALSRQIRKLEDELGAPLLVRTKRQLEITEPGLLLLQRAHSLLRQAGQLADDVRGFESQLSGTVTIGVSPSTCEMFGPPIVRACAARYPALRLNFIEGFSDFIFARLIANELSLCLMHNPPRHHGIEVEPLLTERMYLVGPAKSAGGLPPARAGMKLGKLPLVLPNPTHSLRMLIERIQNRHGEPLNVAIQADGYTMTKALVLAGLGYTVLPESSVRQPVAAGQLSAVRLKDPEMTWTLCLAYRGDQRNARLVNALRVVVRAEIGGAAPTPSSRRMPSPRRSISGSRS